MKWHIYSELFPMLDDGDLQKLADDIAANGQHEPVIVDEKGLILDGRNRSAACTLAGITPTTRVFKGDDAEKLAYVLSLNLHRRHLDTAQRAMVADKLAGLSKGQTKADSGIPLSQPTQADAATMLNVSVDSVKKARKIRKEASPEVVEKVERGELSLNAADATVKPKAKKPADKKIGSAPRSLFFVGDNIDVEVVIDDQPVTVPTKPAKSSGKATSAEHKAAWEHEGRVYAAVMNLLPYLKQIDFDPDSQPKFAKALQSLDGRGRNLVLAMVTHLESVAGLADQLSEIIRK